MADSKRQEDAAAQLSEEDQKRRDRNTLIVFGVMAILVIIGMFLLSGFLSGN